MSAKKKAAKTVLRITQVRGLAGVRRHHRRILKGLGLGRVGRTVVRPNDPCIRGMVDKVSYLVEAREEEA